MDFLRSYILSIAATAMLCTLAIQIVGQKGTSAVVIQMVCGMLIAFSVIKPMGQISLPDFKEYTNSLDKKVSAAVETGVNQTKELINLRITESTVSYVQSKASELGASLSVRISLDQDSIPVQIELTGKISPNAKSVLEEIIQTDLGIRKEDQIWK